MQLIILAHALDGGAQGVANLLAPVLGQRLTLLRPEWLGQARWSQQLSERGKSRTVLHLHGGHRLDSGQIGLVWNRIRLLPQGAFRTSSARDRDYAGAELQALVASWLAELGERVEPPMRHHACVAPVLHLLQWTAVASRCGLGLATAPSVPEDFSVLRTPMELCGAPTHGWPTTFPRACHAMARELGFALLSLGFHRRRGEPLLCRVDAHPALTTRGEVQAVARWLSHRADLAENSEARTTTEAIT